MIERTFIKKNFNKMDLENYLEKKLDRAGFSHLEIIKTPLVTRIVLHVAKPGLAIGKSGATIKELTEKIATDFNIDNPQIEIQEIKNPNLNAKILVNKMASMIDKGYAWRSVAFRMIRDIMGSGAQGVELVFKGALGGKGARKRKQRIALGYMKKIGDQAKYVDRAKAPSNPKCGAIGIKLSIIHPEVVFPDKIDVNKVVSEIKKIKQETKEQEEKNAEATGKKEEIVTKKEEVKEKAENKTEESTSKKEIKTEHKKEENKEGLLEKIEHAVEKVEKTAVEVVEEVEAAAEKVVEKIEEKIEPKVDAKKHEAKKGKK